MSHQPPGPPAVPAGFPACRRCAYRTLARPTTCLACVERAAGAPAGGGARGCAACGQDLPAGGTCPNQWCARADRGWSVAFSVGVHEGALRRAVVDYKYRRALRWAPILARLLAGWLLGHGTWVEDFDLVVPVPAYTGPGARRGWDPVGELAAPLGDLTGGRWEVAFGAVTKAAETPAMAGRSWHQRRAVAEGPLRAALRVPDPAAVAGARVLVLDDVLTDGATLREVARRLRRAGAEEVAGLTLTRPALRSGPSPVTGAGRRLQSPGASPPGQADGG